MSDADQAPYVSFRVDPTPAPAGHYRLLGADVSYYTAKIDAWLAYKRIAHRRELATRACFEQDILPRVGYPVIPVLLTPDNAVLQDTTDMIDTLEAWHPSPPTVPSAPAGRFFCYLFELFCDEWIKMPALHYRWHYDREFAALEFGRNNDPGLPPEAQRAIGHKIASRFSGWLGPLGITAQTAPAVEADYLRLLALLDAHFAHAPTVLGGPPSLADFALYGPLHAHLLRDPASGTVMRAAAPRVVQYLERLRAVPAASNHLRWDLEALPPTLWPIMTLLTRDYVPILLAQHAAVQRWLGTAAPGAVPRDIGRHVVVLGRGTPQEVRGERALFTYDSWMLQRALDVYAGAHARDRAEIERCSALAGTGALLGLDTGHRLRREHFRLVHG